MKKALTVNCLAALSFCLLFLFPAPRATAATLVKVAVVDMQKAINSTAEGMAAKEAIRQKFQQRSEQLESMKAELAAMESKILSPVVSEEALADLKERYSVRKGELEEFYKRAQLEMRQEEQAVVERIYQGLESVVKEIGAREGYTVILEKGTAGVLYQQEGVELTDQVVRLYNEKAQKGELE